MTTFTHTTEFVVEECCNCGVAFAMPEALYKRCKGDSDRWFYCPNGHRQHYTEGDIQKAKRLQREAEQKLARERAAHDQKAARLRDQRDRAENRRRAEKAAKTRIKNRVANGVCPCCNRTFKNLARHMASQHPDFTPNPEPSDE